LPAEVYYKTGQQHDWHGVTGQSFGQTLGRFVVRDLAHGEGV